MVTLLIVVGLVFLCFIGWPVVELLFFLSIEVAFFFLSMCGFVIDTIYDFFFRTLPSTKKKTLATLGGCLLLTIIAIAAYVAKLVTQRE